jgi:hypothetical protein
LPAAAKSTIILANVPGTNCPRGAITETLGIALTGLRLRDELVSERRTNGAGAERPDRHLERGGSRE